MSSSESVGKTVKGRFEGSINWYVEVVKLDLEANGVIERIEARPQRYQLVEG